MADERTVGVREVAIVAIAVVGVVLGAVLLTGYLPVDVQRVLFHTPLLIVILIVGTAGMLWRIATRQPPDS